MALVAAAGFLKLYSTYKEQEVHTIKHMALFFGFFAIFQFLLSLRYFLPISETGGNLIRTSSHIFLYISLAFFSRIATYLLKPEWEKYVFWGILAIGFVFTGIMVNALDTIAPLIAIPTLLVWVGMGTFLFGKMAWDREGSDRVKMALISAGILLIAIAGPMNNIPLVENSLAALVVVQLLVVLGTLVAVAGVYYDHLVRH